MHGNLWQIALLACALVLLAAAAGGAWADAAQSGIVTETTTIDTTGEYQLSAHNESIVDYQTHTVTNTNTSETLTNGTEYVFAPGNGTVIWQPAATDGDPAEIDANLTYHTDRVESQRDVLEAGAVPVGLLIMVVSVFYLWSLATRGF